MNLPAPNPERPSPAGPRLVRDADPQRPTDAPDAIGAWLGLLGTLLRLPEAERRSIRAELEGHLRDRARDLMLSGQSEPEAVSTAISELGDAAELARRYHEASHAPRRRLLMHAAILGLSGAALVTSLVALRTGDHAQTAPASVFQPAAAAAPPDVRVSCGESTNWSQLLTSAGEAARQPYFIDWTELAKVPVGEGSNTVLPDVSIGGVTFKDLPLARALALINRSIGVNDEEGIDAREQEGVLVFSTVAHLDRLEQTLMTFDLSGLVAARRASLDDPAYPADKVVEEATAVLQSLVHPTLWQENGGDRAQMSSFDSRLFIKAPRRIMPQIEWVIAELNKGGNAAPTAVAEPTTRTYPLARAQSIDIASIIGEHRRAGIVRAVADPSSNSVIVTATLKGHESISEFLKTFDAPAIPAEPRQDPGKPLGR